MPASIWFDIIMESLVKMNVPAPLSRDASPVLLAVREAAPAVDTLPLGSGGSDTSGGPEPRCTHSSQSAKRPQQPLSAHSEVREGAVGTHGYVCCSASPPTAANRLHTKSSYPGNTTATSQMSEAGATSLAGGGFLAAPQAHPHPPTTHDRHPSLDPPLPPAPPALCCSWIGPRVPASAPPAPPQ